jgi:predicted DNA-binding transcriptional regulator AlpA
MSVQITDQLYSDREVSLHLKIPLGVLRLMHRAGYGPRCYELTPKLIRYRISDCEEWLRDLENDDIKQMARRRERRQVWTYFIMREGFPRAVKIGKSVDPPKRLEHLQTGVDSRLSLLAQIPGDREKELHGMLSDLRIANEWFRWPDSVYARLKLVNIHL